MKFIRALTEQRAHRNSQTFKRLKKKLPAVSWSDNTAHIFSISSPIQTIVASYANGCDHRWISCIVVPWKILQSPSATVSYASAFELYFIEPIQTVVTEEWIRNLTKQLVSAPINPRQPKLAKDPGGSNIDGECETTSTFTLSYSFSMVCWADWRWSSSRTTSDPIALCVFGISMPGSLLRHVCTAVV